MPEATSYEMKDDAGGDDTVSTGFDSESLYFNPMPLLNYSRLSNSHSVNSARACSCSAMAQVVLDPSSQQSIDSSNPSDTDQEGLHILLRSDLWKQKHNIVALGFDNGDISVISACNGLSLLPEEKLSIREGRANNPIPVVDISFDSTGTMLCAIDEGGAAAIWELKYTVTVQQPTVPDTASATTTTASQENANMFSSIMSALTGMPPPSENTTHIQSDVNRLSQSSVPQLSVSVVHLSRITFPSSWSSPTCLTLDPACKRKRESNLITGFKDGRLVLTRRGGLFQRRNDTVIYHGTPDPSSQSNYGGIETLAWRGTFVAWADASGIKLLDVEGLQRIAHVDRPSGAHPSLYPTITSLRPTLLFETSHNLLVSWGDCIMDIEIKESPIPGTDSKRRSVECSMAWQLDCVSCGVAPMDKDHVVVLGLVPVEDEQDDDVEKDHRNDMEVQILSRKDGAVMYCDSLPILKEQKQPAQVPGRLAESVSSYQLLSSFALPRMENSLEIEETKTYNAIMGEDFEGQQMFSSVGGDSKTVFSDCHLKWNVRSIFFDEDERKICNDEDTSSVDSDDYGFVLRPIEKVDMKEDGIAVDAPIMVIVSALDIVLTQTSTVDDAVTHALSRERKALALNRALRQKRQLRRYNVADLVDHYLHAVLRLQPEEGERREGSLLKAEIPLSLRRMQLAMKSMPYLLGDNVDQWLKWADELASVPGSLFLLREHLPVRDPILPQRLYQHVLQNMFLETEALLRKSAESELKARLAQEAVRHFLESLLAWGPTRILKEHTRLYRFGRGQKDDKLIQRDTRMAERLLQRRTMQTAASYLSFPVGENREGPASIAPRYEAHKDDLNDSLFLVSNLLVFMAQRAPIVTLPEDLGHSKSLVDENPGDLVFNTLVSLDAMARLRMMQNRFDLALKCFLEIGLNHSPRPFEVFEAAALNVVNGESDRKSLSTPIFIESGSKYEFVLALIEYHHLQRLLLDTTFTFNDSQTSTPLFALLRLVGLDAFGRFLVDHCVSPELLSLEDSLEVVDEEASKEHVQRESLPMDLVAKQLEHSPALLYWYLHLVLTKKAELYVKFPNNYVPPKPVTELHRKHFELFVKFAGEMKDSAKSFSGVEKYKVESITTPLLSFLKAALPVGGLSPVEARRVLEIQRNQVDDDDGGEGELTIHGSSNSFSLELAYIIEHYSEESEVEAMGILDLYLDGVKSLMLAVSYAQRQKKYSSLLWDKLINYCLSNEPGGQGDGTLFGALLEASAMFGADLARLVAKIPPGMVVEGLRPRLVAAVADYRLKLDIHEAAAATAKEETVSLLREVAHRSRRGTRFRAPVTMNSPEFRKMESEDPQPPRIRIRRDRHNLSYSIPIR